MVGWLVFLDYSYSNSIFFVSLETVPRDHSAGMFNALRQDLNNNSNTSLSDNDSGMGKPTSMFNPHGKMSVVFKNQINNKYVRHYSQSDKSDGVTYGYAIAVALVVDRTTKNGWRELSNR